MIYFCLVATHFEKQHRILILQSVEKIKSMDWSNILYIPGAETPGGGEGVTEQHVLMSVDFN